MVTINANIQTNGSHEQLANLLTDELMQPVEDWLKTLIQQNLSPHTILAYRASLAQLAQFLINKRLQSLKPAAINALIQADPASIMSATALNWSSCDKRQLAAFVTKRLDTDGIRIVSVQQSLAAIRCFYTWLIETKQARINPATGYQLKRQPRPLPIIATQEVIKQLLEQPLPEDVEQARLWVRDKAMFEMMYSSGLRLSELVGLNVADIHTDTVANNTLANNIATMQKNTGASSAHPSEHATVQNVAMVRVRGKGNATRLVPVGKQALSALQNYLPHRELWLEAVENDDIDALFISEKLGKRLSPRAVQLRLKKAVKRAGIAQNVYPHLLRHCFASHVLSSSGDLRAVQEMLGHRNISTTQIYTHVDFAKLAQVYDKTHPRASNTHMNATTNKHLNSK